MSDIVEWLKNQEEVELFDDEFARAEKFKMVRAEIERLRVLNAKLLAVVEKIWHCVPGEEPDALWDQIATVIEHAKGLRR